MAKSPIHKKCGIELDDHILLLLLLQMRMASKKGGEEI